MLIFTNLIKRQSYIYSSKTYFNFTNKLLHFAIWFLEKKTEKVKTKSVCIIYSVKPQEVNIYEAFFKN